jgi:predicted enzyme related to lactoylglutathione lyase
MERVVHFEIPTEKPESCMEFYKNVFGWKFQQWGEMEYWLADTGDEKNMGINGAITKKSELNPYVVNTIGVENIHSSIEKIKQNGGMILTPVQPIPTMGWFAYCKDPDGNIIGVMQPDANAK